MNGASDYALLSRRCQSILDALDAPKVYSFEAICRWVEELRERPLILRELPSQAAVAGACGLWIGTDDADYVFHEVRTARIHQDHIVLHELAHIICDHNRVESNGNVFGEMLSDLQPHMIKRLMGRTSYTTNEEQEAEMIASLLQSTGKPVRPRGPLGRLGAFLGLNEGE
ncbi:regulator component [Streptomyces sp. NPDC001852]|uniref:regulator component n=1 Tax=Streptomyces sp. NPDC001852 TaxID=3364619 RepID=UPI0036C7FACF